MKRVSNEDPTVVGIEDILRIEPIRVQPQVIIVVFNIEHVQIAVRVGECDTPSMPLFLEYSWNCILFGVLNSPAYHTKYLHF